MVDAQVALLRKLSWHEGLPSGWEHSQHGRSEPVIMEPLHQCFWLGGDRVWSLPRGTESKLILLAQQANNSISQELSCWGKK